LIATACDDADRSRWRVAVSRILPASIVCVDEGGIDAAMTRHRARTPL
jgi:hypothetical protein